jgi:hypothetical protein
MELKCEICVSSFKTAQQYERHMSSKKHKLRVTNDKKMFECIGCNKKFSHSSTLSCHKSKCKKLETISLQEQMIKMRYDFEKEREEMRSHISLLLDKQAGTTTTTNSNNNNNNNNITININAFGEENKEYIDDKIILQCIDRVYKSIPALLQKIHFDPEHPENHNIKITNKKLPYASVMGNNQKWKTVDRKDAIEKMVNNGYYILDEKYEVNKEKFDPRKQKNFECFKEKFEIEEKGTMKIVKSDVEMMIMNGCG